MGKLFGGVAALILLPVLIVVLVAGVDTPPPGGEGGRLAWPWVATDGRQLTSSATRSP